MFLELDVHNGLGSADRSEVAAVHIVHQSIRSVGKAAQRDFSVHWEAQKA